MTIFLSAEIEGPATSKWFELQKIFSKRLSCISNVNYGNSLTSISIISIIMRDDFFEQGGYKERKYYNKARADADIRLRLDYFSFLKGNDEARKRIYIDHILAAINIAGQKAGKNFNLNRLVNDVTHILEE